MNETTVVNLFLTIRVLVVGGILLLLPRITRKGLMFGAYVGEETAQGDAARRLLRRWDRGCLAIMALSLFIGWGISLAGRPLTGNLTGTAVLLLAALAFYFQTYSRARDLAPPEAARQAERVAAPLDASEPKGEGLAKLALGICLTVGIASAVYAIVAYQAMPDRVPALFDSSSSYSGSEKSLITFLFTPTLNLVITPFFALLALLTARAKRSVRGGSGGQSLAAQDAFRATVTKALSAIALLLCASLAIVSVQIVRVALGHTRSFGITVLIVSIGLLAAMVATLIWIMRHGQGGALREAGSAESPLTGGLANNANWVWGFFYVDKNDPSIMVEKRFGIGYTLNYGNPKAVLIVATFAMLMGSLLALAVIAASS